jgi:hypothetical protein
MQHAAGAAAAPKAAAGSTGTQQPVRQASQASTSGRPAAGTAAAPKPATPSQQAAKPGAGSVNAGTASKPGAAGAKAKAGPSKKAPPKKQAGPPVPLIAAAGGGALAAGLLVFGLVKLLRRGKGGKQEGADGTGPGERRRKHQIHERPRFRCSAAADARAAHTLHVKCCAGAPCPIPHTHSQARRAVGRPLHPHGCHPHHMAGMSYTHKAL